MARTHTCPLVDHLDAGTAAAISHRQLCGTPVLKGLPREPMAVCMLTINCQVLHTGISSRHTGSVAAHSSPVASSRAAAQRLAPNQRRSWIAAATATPVVAGNNDHITVPLSTTPATPPAAAANDITHPARVAGALLGGMCGDVLGHPWEGHSLTQLKALQPAGITTFLTAPRWPLAGRYSGITRG